MGITLSAVQKMDELGLFSKGGISILDIGSSNLYSATPEGVKVFLRKYAPVAMDGVDEFAARLAHGSAYDPVTGGRNEAFAGELFEKAGMQYRAFDIAYGYRTTILDLNCAVLPASLQKRFDLVLNFGTTEHILNQLNCFKVIHDATKIGGYIYHQLPAIGYVNHGYVTYTGRCFFDLAGFNEYELVACWFDGPSGGGCILDSLRSYSLHFPALEMALKRIPETEQGRVLRDLRIPDIGINVVYRKVKDKPFLGALESSTSVGAIPQEVLSAYDGPWARSAAAAAWSAESGTALALRSPILASLKQRAAAALRDYPPLYRVARRAFHALTRSRRPAPSTAENPLTSEELELRDRLLAGNATLDEGLRLYSSMTGRGLAFPFAWEELVLRLCLKAEPDRPDLKARLRQVLTLQDKPVPPETE